MKEIEILIEVKSEKETALKALEKFEFQGVKKTLDIYFVDPLRKDLQPNVDGRLGACFRIRQKDGKNSIAYKVDHFIGDEWSHSDEFETEVKDFGTALKIIQKLGLKELIRIDNEKHIFVTPEYEIVLEDVKDLGLFMEVEKLLEVPDEKVGETKEEIRRFLKNLDIELGEEQNAGKPELMLRKKS
jgi:predicted adenylyl cyclase CyaB